MANLRQKRVVKHIPESTCLKEAIEKAGYSPKTAQKPAQVMRSKGVQEELKPIIEQLEEERQEIIKEMKLKRESADYSSLTRALAVTTEKIQLLNGESTSNANLKITWGEDNKDPVHT